MTKIKKCKDHPTYSGKRVPRALCKECWQLYLTLHPDKVEQYKDIVKKYKFRIPKYIKNLCKKHNSYMAKKVPISGCNKCWEFYRVIHKLTDKDIVKLKKELKLRKVKVKTDQIKQKKIVEKKQKKVDNLKFIVANNKLINVAIYFNQIVSKDNYAQWIKESFKGMKMQVISNPDSLCITGNNSILFFDDPQLIYDLLFPYHRKLINQINYFIFITCGKPQKSQTEYSNGFWNPDSVSTRSMYYDMNSLNKVTFKRVIDKQITEVYREKLYIKLLIKNRGERKNEK